MTATIRIRDPKSGQTGTATPDALLAALQGGAEVLDAVDIYDPETKAIGRAEPTALAAAVANGAVPVGSRAHAVATTGKLESLARGVGQGATFGFLDEIMGGVKSAFGSQTYRQARDEYRQNDSIAHEANPITSTIGNIGGSVATAMLPIPGLALAKGATLGQEVMLGAKLGGISGLGTSEAEDVGGMARNVVEGTVLGGVGGAVAGVAHRAVTRGGAAAREVVEAGLNPETQRAHVLGLRKVDFKNMGVDDVNQHIDELAKHGVFGGGTREKVFENIENLRTDTANQIRQKITGKVYAPIDTWAAELRGKFGEVVMGATPGERNALGDEAQRLLAELYDTGGSVASAWELKKKAGNWVNDWFKAKTDQPGKMQLYQELYGYLGTKITSTVDDVAKEANDATLSALNKTYAATANIQDTLRHQIEADILSGRIAGGLNVSDYLKGNVIGAAVQGATGIPGIGTAAGIMSALGASAMRSPSGRLARAKLGETMGLGVAGARVKAEQDAAAIAQGAIPRSLNGLRGWIKGMQPGFIPPQYQKSIERIMKLPDSAAEVEVRMLMPLIGQMMSPSPFESEFNGKISSPPDRIAATQITKAQGLPPGVTAYHISMLNKGTLQDYHHAKASEDYGDELLQFNERLTSMGY